MILWNRKVRGQSLTTLGALLAALGILPLEATAFPLEKFDHQVEVSCAGSSSCARSLRAKTTLGAYTGIWVRGDAEMNSSVSAKQGKLQVKASGSSLGGIVLSWDSDTYADQLSSAGLRCIDMRHQEGSAIVIEDFALQGRCQDSDGDGECSPFVIETRVFDTSDPTGQTYSASILRRANNRDAADLIIPFSNFNKKGLRGEGRLGCAGAVSITIRTDGYQEVTLSAGPIFTNSAQPLDALVLTPTPTAPPAVPTRSDAVPATPKPEPTVAPTVAATGTPDPSVDGTPLPSETASAETGAQSPALSRVVVAPLGASSPEPEREPEEVVYGEIINE